ncbi:MAG: hypothetical protein ACAF41_18365 [Leptolyngbya sp. BL-A-14]
MLRFMQTSSLLTLASLLLTSQVKAETTLTPSTLPQPPSQSNIPQPARCSTPKLTESQGSLSTVPVKPSNQLKDDGLSERDHIILQYQLQQIIPAE